MDHIIAENLDKYLNSTRLSMNQVAAKWGVSTPLLSQIKTGKKKAGLELGLKILREAGVDLNVRQQWLEERKTQGEESAKIFDDLKKERVEYRLQKNICEHLAANPILIDLFLDISLMKEKGLSWNGILKNFGEYGLDQVEFLVSAGLVEKRNDRFYIIQDKLPHAINAENSFGLMSGIFEIFRKKVVKQEFRGEFHFDITDVSQEGYEKLKELNIEFTKKMVNIIKETEQARTSGGIRVVAQNLIGVLKILIIAVFANVFIDNSYAQGNGLTGGASGKIITVDQVDVGELIAVPKQSFHYGKSPSTIIIDHEKKVKVEFQPGSFATPMFETKEEAVEGAVKINQIFKEGSINQDDARRLVQRYSVHCRDNSSDSMASNEAAKQIKKGSVVAIGFNVEQSYTPEGKPLFRAIGNYLIPCPTKN